MWSLFNIIACLPWWDPQLSATTMKLKHCKHSFHKARCPFLFPPNQLTSLIRFNHKSLRLQGDVLQHSETDLDATHVQFSQ